MSNFEAATMQYVEDCQAEDHPDFPHYHYQAQLEGLVFEAELMEELLGRGAGDPDVHGYPGQETADE